MIVLSEENGCWCAHVAWRSLSGRRLTASEMFPTRAQATEWAQGHDRKMADQVRENLTVAQLVLGWHDDRVGHLRDTTVAREECMLQRHIAADPIGRMNARSVTRRDAAAFSERLKLKPNGRGATLAPKTRRGIQKAIRQAFDASWDIDVNPFARVALPSLPDTEAAFLSIEEIDRLLKQVALHKWGWVYGVLVLTGLRRSEFCGLRWQDVNLDGAYIEVKWRRSTAGSAVVEGALKTRRARRQIPLDPMASRLLTARVIERDSQRMLWGPDWCEDGDQYVWCREDGSKEHPDKLTSQFDEFCTRARITNVGLHGLRHSFAAVAIAAGMAGYSLSRVMGHSQVTFTYTVYGHLFNDGLVGEMGKLSAFLGTVAGGALRGHSPSSVSHPSVIVPS